LFNNIISFTERACSRANLFTYSCIILLTINKKNRIMETKKQLSRIVKSIEKNNDWFRSLWEDCADEYDFYELAQIISDECGGLPAVKDFNLFDKGWQYRTILHENYKEAKNEFANLLFGFW